jgi:hypothetical protein
MKKKGESRGKNKKVQKRRKSEKKTKEKCTVDSIVIHIEVKF